MTTKHRTSHPPGAKPRSVLCYGGAEYEMKPIARRRGVKHTVGSTEGASLPKPRKELTAKERRTPKGRFAVHLASLLSERGWTHQQAAAKFGVGEATVRKWLRAESVPETLDLERIGKALNTPDHPFPDYRLLLPPG